MEKKNVKYVVRGKKRILNMLYQYPFKEAKEDLIKKVWEKGKRIIGKDQNLWQKDICGTLMFFDDHGNTDSKYGWEIDHKKPISKGGKDNLNNLQPLQWENNRKKVDRYPSGIADN